jgi:hypothetical protein
MIISQRVYTNAIGRSFGSLLNKGRVDGTMFGDTKTYTSTDVLETRPWGGDAESQNLLQLYRPKNPETQAITINVFRYVAVTVDYYLTKQAWSTETAFSDFTGRQLAWLEDTKYIYDSCLYNTYIGTAKSTAVLPNGIDNKQNMQISLPKEPEGGNIEVEAYNRLVALTIGETLANLLINLKDPSRYYNDYGFMRSRDESELVVVWNASWVNQIRYVDLPTVFHKDGTVPKFEQETLPARFWGNINTNSGDAPMTNLSIRSLYEATYDGVHVFPGELLPGGASYEANTTYTEDPTIMCKVMHKESVPYMSGFSTGNEFFNPASLTNTHRLIFGHNPLEYLKEYPFITIKAAPAA